MEQLKSRQGLENQEGEEPSYHCKGAAKKSSRPESSSSQDNNTIYFKQQRPTWQSCQREWPEHKIKHLKYAKENIEMPEGRMDSSKYQEILVANVQRSVQTLKLKRGWVFQQDNDWKHTSKSNIKYLQERRMKVFEWPPHSQPYL